MIAFEEALKRIVDSAKTLGIEVVDYRKAKGKVLAEDILSDLNMPPFNKAAMDGYACRKADLTKELEVIEVIAAGFSPTKKVGEGQCSKIMTGAPVPDGADTVIMVEHTEVITEHSIRFTNQKTSSNICYLAEDIKQGDLVLHKGTLLETKHIPVLASVGAHQVKVYKVPKIAVVSTGDELVEPEIVPNASQIRNSNAYQLLAQAQQMGLETEYIGIAKDTLESTKEMLNKAIQNADVILMSGAVSMGDFDFVPIALKESGIKIHFHGVETKPGKKTVFGTNDNKWFVGVPGNPVSSYVQFEMLIKPLLFHIMGADYKTPLYRLQMGEGFKRKHNNRKAFEPIVIGENGTVMNINYHGSAHINALSYSNGLMIVEKGISELKVGDFVDVRPI